MNVKVLGTIYTMQAFLPAIHELKPRVLMLTPTIISSVASPFHSVESSVVGALEGFTYSLAAELRTVDVQVCHFKMGTFDFSSAGGRQHMQRIPGTALRTWDPSTRARYGRNFVTHLVGGVRGSPSRELSNAVFDAIVHKRPNQTWRLGRGSVAYEVVGNWAPPSVLGWMLGLRNAPRGAWEPSLEGGPEKGEEAATTSSDDGGQQSVQWEQVEHFA
jgi:NAD(P)-dependent dehydrogenase (short-subunit alcohol dehydrogenase family)